MKKIAALAVCLAALPALGDAGNWKVKLSGYQEVPSVSTLAEGTFEAKAAGDWNSIEWTLTYSGLQAPVQQAHIHFAQSAVNGPIVIWLCQTAAVPAPASQSATQTCPGTSGSLSGTITSSNVLAAPASQQLAAGEIGEIISAMLNGVAYVNVHTTVSPGGEIRGQFK
jgi:CHRD domain